MAWKLTSEYQQKYAKKDAIRIANALNQKGIDCELESEVLREGEFNPRGRQKAYYVDVAIIDSQFFKIGIDMDGAAHSGKEAEDMERDEYLRQHGFKAILHFPNRTPSEKVIQTVLSYQKEFL